MDKRSGVARASDLVAVTGAVVFVGVLGCKGSSNAVADSGPLSLTTTAAVADSPPPVLLAPPSASAPVKHPSANQPAPKGCPDGWTKTTKGICVDWCETNDDCDAPKTCQDSPHVDPDLGKIKTCQAPAPPAAEKNSDVVRLEMDDKGHAIGKCPAGRQMIPMSYGGDDFFECRQLCTKDSDCGGKNTCSVRFSEDKFCGIP